MQITGNGIEQVDGNARTTQNLVLSTLQLSPVRTEIGEYFHEIILDVGVNLQGNGDQSTLNKAPTVCIL